MIHLRHKFHAPPVTGKDTLQAAGCKQQISTHFSVSSACITILNTITLMQLYKKA